MPTTVRSDPAWMADFRARYPAWWTQAAPLIANHQYAQAFKTYPWPTFEEAPWTPVAKPLAESRIAVVTTAGLYRRDVDRPFDADAPEGDASYRALPSTVDPGALAIAHAHFPHEVAAADLNTIFPLEPLCEFAGAGVVGDVAPTHYSTMGYAVRAADLAETTAPAIAARMREEAVDIALIVPV